MVSISVFAHVHGGQTEPEGGDPADDARQQAAGDELAPVGGE